MMEADSRNVALVLAMLFAPSLHARSGLETPHPQLRAEEPSSVPMEARVLAIDGVTIVDVESGQLVPGQTVLITGRRITEVGPVGVVRIPANATVLTGKGGYLLPGLWDMHTHLNGKPSDRSSLLPGYIANGVTGVREMWSDPPGVLVDDKGTTMLQWQQRLGREAAAGIIAGPRLVTTTAPINGPHGSDGHVNIVRAAGDVKPLIQAARLGGVDAVGIYPWLGRAAYAAAARQASARGLPVVGVMPVTVTLQDANAANHRIREGLLEWELACSGIGDKVRADMQQAAVRDAAASAKPTRTLEAEFKEVRPLIQAEFDPGVCARTAREAAAFGIWQTPRLVYGSMGGEHSADAAPYLPAQLRKDWQASRAKLVSDQEGTRAKQQALHRTIVRTLAEAGVPLLVGTESYWGSPSAWGFSVHEELAELVQAGVEPASALRAATLNPARALGREHELGTVEAGKLADLLLLEADPLQGIENTRRIRAVIANGRLFDRAALDSLLVAAKDAAEDR